VSCCVCVCETLYAFTHFSLVACFNVLCAQLLIAYALSLHSSTLLLLISCLNSESLDLLERLGDALQDYELAQAQLSTANRSLYIQRDNSTTDVDKIKHLRRKHRRLLRAGELHSDDFPLQFGETLGEDLGSVQFSELGDVTRTSLSGTESVVFNTSLQRGNRSIGHKLANAARVATFQKPQPVKGLSACTECAMKVNQYGR
jgi:hypothetical protein